MIYESLIKEKFYKILKQIKSDNLHILEKRYSSLVENAFIKKDYKRLKTLLLQYFTSDKNIKSDISEFLKEIDSLYNTDNKLSLKQKIKKEDYTSFIDYLKKDKNSESSYEKLFKVFFENLNNFLGSLNNQQENSFLKESLNTQGFSFNKSSFDDLNIGKEQAQEEILKYQKKDSKESQAKDIKEEFLEDIKNIEEDYTFQNLKENLYEVSSREKKQKREEEILKYQKRDSKESQAKDMEEEFLEDIKNIEEDYDFQNLKENLHQASSREKKQKREEKNPKDNKVIFKKHILKPTKESPFYFRKLPEEIKKGRLKDKINLTYDLKYIFNSFPYRKYRKLLNEALKYINANNLHEALEYYYVIYDQKLPHTIKIMIKKNIADIESTLTRASVRKKFFFK